MRALISAFALLVQNGCSLDAGVPATATYAVRDSGGIEIVESTAPLWANEQLAWRIDPRPLVDIGVTYGAAGEQLTNVRGTLRLPDGRIVVGELEANIKYFDSTGKHLTTLSRRGQGPGEGNVVTGLHHYRGDSILMRTGRSAGPREVQNANVLDANGRQGRPVPITWPRGEVSDSTRSVVGGYTVGLQGIMNDGSFIIRGSALVELRGAAATRAGIARFFRVSADGARADSLLAVTVTEVEETPPGPVLNYRTPIFAIDAPKAAVRDPFMYWGTGARFEINVYELRQAGPARATLVRTIRAPHPPRPAGAAELEQYIRRALSGAATIESARSRRVQLERLPVRPTLPAFSTLLIDADANLWVEHYRITRPTRELPRDSSDVPRWTVFNPNGAMLGDLLTPPGLEITTVGSDWVMGVWSDMDGVQHVRVNRLTKP